MADRHGRCKTQQNEKCLLNRNFSVRHCSLKFAKGRCWRRGRDSNPRYPYEYAAFRVRCIQPLCHLSKRLICMCFTICASPSDGHCYRICYRAFLFSAFEPGFSSLKCRIQSFSRFGLHIVGNVRIQVHRRRDGRVTKALLSDFGVDTIGEQLGGV